MIRLFVSDIDGTLLNEKHVLSKGNEDAIYSLKEAGIEFMLASGRHYEGTLLPIKHMNLALRCISLNGGDVRDYDGTNIFTQRISDSSVNKVYEIAQNLDTTMEYYCEDFAYTQVPFDVIEEVYIENFAKMFYMDLKEAEILVKAHDIKNTMTYEASFGEIKKHHPLKMEFHFKDLKEKQKALKQLNILDDIQLASSAPLNLEVTHKEASKGRLLKLYCERFGYKKEEVVVIGDSENDISMLSSFPNSYAMDNAENKIKKVAKNIAPSNAQDGVAQIINKIINENRKKT